jgi:hypothetical protein
LTNLWLNRVQHLGGHENLNIDVDYLNRMYLEGYIIKHEYEKPVKDWGTLPEAVYLISKNN